MVVPSQRRIIQPVDCVGPGDVVLAEMRGAVSGLGVGTDDGEGADGGVAGEALFEGADAARAGLDGFVEGVGGGVAVVG